MKFLFTLFLILVQFSILSQSISGYIFDENNAPVPFANIFIKPIEKGISTSGEGKYFYEFFDFGDYEIIVSAVGFETQKFKVVIDNQKPIIKNVWLKTDVKQLKEIVIKSKGRDPAYGIISKAIENKKKWDTQIESSKCEVYIKGREIISEKERQKRERKRKRKAQQERIEEESKIKTEEEIREESLNAHKKEISKIVNEINMMEVKMERHYQAPNKIKEIRSAYKKYGNTFGLFYKNTIQNEFNFYDNLMNMYKLNEVPLVSPLNTLSVLTYKFKLIETKFDSGIMVWKIQVTPRKKGNATWEGHIWIRDNTFNIDKVDLWLHKGGLLKYDDFRIKQEFFFNKDSVLLTYRQEFDYEEKSGRTNFKGQTTVVYSNYELDITFPKRYFNNEVGLTTAEAYERDSSYWKKIRPEPLTKKEQRFQFVKDSIYEYVNSPLYLDSIDSVYNRVTLVDIFWDGVGFRNRSKKEDLWVSSVPLLLGIDPLGILRLGPRISYNKIFKNEKSINLYSHVNIGLLNEDIKGTFRARYLYDPKHLGSLEVQAGKQFDILSFSDAFTTVLDRGNYIQTANLSVSTRRELVNGLYGFFSYQFDDRSSIEGYKYSTFFDKIFPGTNNVALDFDGYNTSRVNLALTYIPFQKYMMEPKKKVVLGSNWPAFRIDYEKGLKGLFGSEIDYDFVEFSIRQSFFVRTMGRSSYHFEAGKFLNTKNLRREDNIRFGRSDRWFFASFLTSMQLQDTTLWVTDSYLKFNYIHHFNGALINNIPLIKKLRLQTVIGTSGLLIPQSNYKYFEYFLGIERAFKIARTRFKLGVYGVEAISNYNNIDPRIKFGIHFTPYGE